MCTSPSPNAWQILAHLILSATLCSKYDCYFHFIDGETEAPTACLVINSGSVAEMGFELGWPWLECPCSAPVYRAGFVLSTYHLLLTEILWEQKCTCYSHLTETKTEDPGGLTSQGWAPVSWQSHSCSAIPCLLHVTSPSWRLPLSTPWFSYGFTSQFFLA